eukprot:TRINITY_DN63297_c0_g2_i1.p1 TRINITY_DN63297_c0_g2~~TRINITY_DN63297_c0_g2_i1.p1  ORF type:complete len:468 (+),score=19.37 TRINITY_DN63297_c0_g2_i1:77-1480(+)
MNTLLRVMLVVVFMMMVASIRAYYTWIISKPPLPDPIEKLPQQPEPQKSSTLNLKFRCKRLTNNFNGFQLSVCRTTSCFGEIRVQKLSDCPLDIPKLSNDADTNDFLHTFAGPHSLEVKLSGPSWVMAQQQPYKGNCSYVFTYQLVDVGNHTLSVRLLYDSYQAVTEMYDVKPPKWQAKFLGTSLLPPTPATLVPCTAPPDIKKEKRCSTGEDAGRWVGVEPDKRTHFEWRPYSCNLPTTHWTEKQTASCLGGQKIAVLGDSQQRSMYYGLRNFVAKDKIKNNPKALGGRVDVVSSDVAQDVTLVFETDPWLDHKERWYRFLDGREAVSVLLVGWGNWPAAGSIGSQGKWSNTKYLAHTKKKAQELAAFQQNTSNSNTRVFWLGMPAFPVPPIDTRRNNQRLAWMTDSAAAIMKQHGIQVIDTFNVSLAMTHISKDHAHFRCPDESKEHHVVRALAAIVVNIICQVS